MKAFITGVCGQDGWYLSAHLVSLGYEVIGTRRGNEEPAESPPGIQCVYGDVTDSLCIRDLVEKHRPDEIYNLAAVTHVGDSFSAMAACFKVNAVGAANCLDAGARVGAKVYQASTSELFGATDPPQSEDSPMQPRSPYGVAKLAAYWLARNYRERGVFACTSFLFNHESPLRKPGFVSRKITSAVARIKAGSTEKLRLGNLDAERDWGFAGDYVRAIWMSMQEAEPDEYVIATGSTHSVREFAATAFRLAGLNWEDHVVSDDGLRRPLEVERLQGDPRKAHTKLGWRHTIVFEELIEHMLWTDMKRVSGQVLTKADMTPAGFG
jgi:GDPmannose 4,6-dehydratase